MIDPQKFRGIAISVGAMLALITIAIITIYAVIMYDKAKDVALMGMSSLISVVSFMWGRRSGDNHRGQP